MAWARAAGLGGWGTEQHTAPRRTALTANKGTEHVHFMWPRRQSPPGPLPLLLLGSQVAASTSWERRGEVGPRRFHFRVLQRVLQAPSVPCRCLGGPCCPLAGRRRRGSIECRPPGLGPRGRSAQRAQPAALRQRARTLRPAAPPRGPALSHDSAAADCTAWRPAAAAGPPMPHRTPHSGRRASPCAPRRLARRGAHVRWGPVYLVASGSATCCSAGGDTAGRGCCPGMDQGAASNIDGALSLSKRGSAPSRSPSVTERLAPRPLSANVEAAKGAGWLAGGHMCARHGSQTFFWYAERVDKVVYSVYTRGGAWPRSPRLTVNERKA